MRHLPRRLTRGVPLVLLAAALAALGAAAPPQAEEPEYAGGAACLQCHEDTANRGKGSAHFQIDCESCHGPLGAHAKDPEQHKGVLPDNAICLMCHEAGQGMPSHFPQVDPARHNRGKTCISCHPAHHPEEGEKKKK